MTRAQLGIVLFTTFLTFCTLYTPQPILPHLVNELGISINQAALLMTATLIPLGLAPIFYGYFLQAIPARLMLTIALGLLAVDQIALFFATEYWHLLGLRFAQGVLMPALFTALMTYCATMSAPERIRGTMGLYIAATIVGGFSSRALSGYLSAHIGWQWVFLILGLALLVPLALMRRIGADAEINFARLDTRAVGRVLAVPNYRYSYLALFLIFFVFTGILSLIPFRILEIAPEADSFVISLVYIGYIIGIPVAIMTSQIGNLLGGVRPTLFCGTLLVIAGLLSYFDERLIVLFTMMLAYAAGIFLIHSTLSGYLNQISREHKGVVNGIYVSVYYISGTLGSLLPFPLYQATGWQITLVIFIATILPAAYFISRLTR